jgi:hypothetical protein
MHTKLSIALAVFATSAVLADDADMLRAMLSPPPSRAAAERLVVDAKRAHLWLTGWSQPASLRARLDAFRVLVATARAESKNLTELARLVALTLESTEPGWRPPLRRLEPPPPSEWTELLRQQAQRAPFRWRLRGMAG